MRIGVLPIVLSLLLLGQAFPKTANAKAVGLVSSSLVDHPVTLPLDVRSSATWRSRVGAWGENFADHSLRLRGYGEIHEIKTASNNGIDRVAIKRNLDGTIFDVKFVEVKVSPTNSPKLNQTRAGKQMSLNWVEQNLMSMRNNGDDASRKLALEIDRFEKASDRSIESMGEVMHINPHAGRLTGYCSDGKTVKYSQSVERFLVQIEEKGSSKAARQWAKRSLTSLDQIRNTRMMAWLGTTTSQQARRTLISSVGHNEMPLTKALARQVRTLATKRILLRLAGPAALLASLAVDAGELADTVSEYRRGSISLRQRNVRLVTKAGGIAGSFAGVWAGGATGAWLGGLGGPFAWLTAPAGAIIGGAIGGYSGYVGGSAVAAYAATSWYDSIDRKIQNRFEMEWIAQAMPTP